MKETLPQFDAINPDTIEAKLKQLLNRNKGFIDDRLAKGPPFTWDNFIEPIETLEDELHQFWSITSHLNSVTNTPVLRKVYNTCLPQLSDYSTQLLHNKEYYEAIRFIAAVDQKEKNLDFAQKKMIENALRDFKLAGVSLAPEEKEKFANLSKTLWQLTTKFGENVLDATQAWTKLISNKSILSGLPQHALETAAAAAQKQSKQGWLFTLEAPSFLAVMTHADSQDLRKEMYLAFITKASQQSPSGPQFDNTEIISTILKTRLQLARLLGFEHYAEYSLATKMAENTTVVIDFLNSLAEASLEKARSEFAELQHFSETEYSLNTLEPWDIAYISEKLRKARYDISQEELRPYFPEYQVLTGLFHIVHKLFGVTFKPVPYPSTWHQDVKCFSIYDKDNALLSHCYFDLYARKNKRSGAWMDDYRTRRINNNCIQTPIAFVVCNFNAPVGNDPALFTHDDVVTLFHELGHALQHMLTKINYPAVSGIHGVPWDAVELPSQFLEHWAYEKEGVALISKHYQTQSPLPDHLFKKLHNAKNFQSALQMVRQLEFALFDFRLHAEFDPNRKNHVVDILQEVRSKVRVLPSSELDHFQNSFSHIFSGGYAAGYYSYKWAEVMASDAFSTFKEKGLFNADCSHKFLKTFLEMGGAKDPLSLFIECFSHRPRIEALLKETGILSEH